MNAIQKPHMSNVWMQLTVHESRRLGFTQLFSRVRSVASGRAAEEWDQVKVRARELAQTTGKEVFVFARQQGGRRWLVHKEAP